MSRSFTSEGGYFGRKRCYGHFGRKAMVTLAENTLVIIARKMTPGTEHQHPGSDIIRYVYNFVVLSAPQPDR